jgi:hypothetical protein
MNPGKEGGKNLTPAEFRKNGKDKRYQMLIPKMKIAF